MYRDKVFLQKKENDEITEICAVSPILNLYIGALEKEKIYLQREGGRQYKVSDGKRLNTQNGLVTYAFDMESELFLSDDAPIKLKVGIREIAGNVLICEGFSITILVEADLGYNIPSAIISVEPWKLLEAQVNKLMAINKQDKIAMKMIEEGPKLALDTDWTDMHKGQDEVKRKITNSEIAIVWGPPGTGKSYTMANIAIDFLSRDKSVLMVSHSNISVDGVVNQVVAQLKERKKSEWLSTGKILRYGYVRDEKLSENRDVVSFNYTLDKNPDLKFEMELFQNKKSHLKNTDSDNKKRDFVEKRLRELRADIKAKEIAYVNKARMVATTISKVTIAQLFDEKKYDLVMFDEVSMAYVTQVFCAAKLARQKFLCVGDFNQLSPIVQSDAKNLLCNDIFSYLKIMDGRGNFHNHKWLVMLDEQRRMLPAISAFPSRYIYKNLLRNHESVLNKHHLAQREPFIDEAMVLVDLAGTHCVASKNVDNSRYNIVSAILSFALAMQANVENSKEEVGIISPYAAQARLIRAMVLDEFGKDVGQIACATVHQFQGSERDTIIFDTVESYPGTQAGFLMSKNENRSLIRLINVAMTRARGKFIVQANSQFWLKAIQTNDNFVVKLLKYMLENSYVIKHANTRTFEKMISNMEFGKHIKYYEKYDAALKELQKDIIKARTDIVVSLPVADLHLKQYEEVYKALIGAKAKGISVYVKASDFENLPDEWKKISQQSENAVFPLIVIDGNVVWYGMPKANWMFKGKNHESFKTVVPLYFRMNGKHTVDMIRSLTDIEMQVVENVRKPLSVSESISEERTKYKSANDKKGIQEYVSNLVKCQVCKEPMIVTRSFKGKVYLKCASGDREHNAFLTKEIVKAYIMQEKPVCPQCKARIKTCGVSKFGLWVMCENGHYPKPDEI